MTRQFARIDWIDSYSPFHDDAWRDLDELVATIEVGPPQITSVGVVIFEDERQVALAASTHDDRACGVMVIPKPFIVDRENWDA